MTRRAYRAGVLLVLAAVAALVAVPVLGVAGAAPGVRAASPDLTLVTNATYVVQPAQGRVHVVVDVTAANHRADTKTSKYYFDHAFLAVQAGASAPKASGLKGVAASIASKDSKSTLLRINFGQRVYGGSTVKFRLTFELADPGSTAGRLVRVGTSLITFPVWAFATTATSGSSVTVHFPAGYNVVVEAGKFATTTASADGGTDLATGPIAAPLNFYAYVSGQQPATYKDQLLTVPVTAGAIVLQLRAWVDDPTWAGRVSTVFERALPLLRTDIGFAWPYSDPVVVQEAVSRSADGHAGTYSASGALIEIAYWTGDPLIIHEAAHGWFNGRLLADRWAVEGFASLYARRTTIALGTKVPAPALSKAQAAGAFPLNAWTAVQAPDPVAEAYGLAASAVLASAIADRAGDAALKRVWLDAADRIGAYQPPASANGTAAAETVDGAPDWRTLLDLLEAESGRNFTDLWRAWVVRPGEASLLDARAAARSTYTQTLAAAGSWTLPRSIRDALRAWQFNTATALMTDAQAVLAQRADLDARAARSGVTLPDTMQTLFETGALQTALAEASRERAAIAAIDTAAASRTSTQDMLSTIGMLGEQPEADLAAARAALAGGRVDDVMPAASRAYRAWVGSWQEGRRRAVFAIALLAAIVVLGSSAGAMARRSLRGRHTTPPAD